MSITVRHDATGRVIMLSSIDAPDPAKGDISVEALPDAPAPIPAKKKIPVLYVRDGKPVWEMEVDPDAPDPDAPAPEPAQEPKTREEVRAEREAAYRRTVDPLTAEISRLRDMAPGDPRIAEAEAEREAAVSAIVAANPYPEGSETEPSV